MLRHLTEYLVKAKAREELVAPLKEALRGFLDEAAALLSGVDIRTEEGAIGSAWLQAAYDAIEEEPPAQEAIALSTRVWVSTEDRGIMASLRDDLEETLKEYGFSVWQSAGLVIVDLDNKKVALVGFCRQLQKAAKATSDAPAPEPASNGESEGEDVFA